MPNRRIVPDEKRCPQCGKTFLVGGRGRPPRRAIYCSRTCRNWAQRRSVSLHPERLAERELAYLAGIIDGEGYISLYKRKDAKVQGRPSLKVVIVNTSRELIDWLEAAFPGTKARAVDTSHRNPNASIRWDWIVFGMNAVALLEAVLPYLVVKRERALLAIRSQALATRPLREDDEALVSRIGLNRAKSPGWRGVGA